MLPHVACAVHSNEHSSPCYCVHAVAVKCWVECVLWVAFECFGFYRQTQKRRRARAGIDKIASNYTVRAGFGAWHCFGCFGAVGTFVSLPIAVEARPRPRMANGTLASWHSNTYAVALPLSGQPLRRLLLSSSFGLSLNMQVSSANGAKNPLELHDARWAWHTGLVVVCVSHPARRGHCCLCRVQIHS